MNLPPISKLVALALFTACLVCIFLLADAALSYANEGHGLHPYLVVITSCVMAVIAAGCVAYLIAEEFHEAREQLPNLNQNLNDY